MIHFFLSEFNLTLKITIGQEEIETNLTLFLELQDIFSQAVSVELIVLVLSYYILRIILYQEIE